MSRKARKINTQSPLKENLRDLCASWRSSRETKKGDRKTTFHAKVAK
jgi:hypothetical protein